MRPIKAPAWIVIFATIVLACAKQGPPMGGPEDKSPPTIVQVSPPPNSTRITLNAEVIILFSERVEKKSVEESFFISPRPAGEPQFHWKGKRLKIKFPQGLKENKTYVLTIGSDARDLRGNRMAESFALAFATGDSLDQGVISGRVYGEGRVAGTLIWAYSLTSHDTPNPTKDEPEYVTQCGVEGNYSLTYLSPDTYRLFAVLDRNGNRLYEPETDALGVTTADVTIHENNLKAAGCNFQITVRDTTRPGLSRASTDDHFHLTLKFDEPLASQKIDSLHNYLVVSLNGPVPDTLALRLAYQDPTDQTKVQLITEQQTAGVEYQVTVYNLQDLWGNLLNTSSNQVIFSGSSIPDTLRPQLVFYSPRDSSRRIPLDEKIELTFSEAMTQNSVTKHLIWADTSGNKIKGTLFWKNPAQVLFTPESKLQSHLTYQVQVQLDSIFDLFGNSVADSSFRFIFTTINADTLSSISGMVFDELGKAVGRIYLTATQTQKQGQSYQISMNEPGPYVFSDILPGIYLIRGFRDADGNSRYSYGEAVPFIPAERFVVYPDSVKVRSRWPNEGNDLVFKKD